MTASPSGLLGTHNTSALLLCSINQHDPHRSSCYLPQPEVRTDEQCRAWLITIRSYVTYARTVFDKLYTWCMHPCSPSCVENVLARMQYVGDQSSLSSACRWVKETPLLSSVWLDHASGMRCSRSVCALYCAHVCQSYDEDHTGVAACGVCSLMVYVLTCSANWCHR